MTVREPMQFGWIETTDVARYLNDDAYAFEQKMDGTRGMAVITSEEVFFVGKGGVGRLSHTAATQHFATLVPALKALMADTEGEIVLDGEIMIDTGEYRLFDVPYVRIGQAVVVGPESPLSERREVLEIIAAEPMLVGTPVKLVRQARGVAGKTALLREVRENGGEGVMIKSLSSPYLPGQRVTTTVKLKFVKTADVVVLAVNRPDAKHGSFVLGAHNPDRSMRVVGACSAIGKPVDIAVGDVVEVNYLYWTGEALYQPRMMRKRDDKAPYECTLSQFRPYSRIAV